MEASLGLTLLQDHHQVLKGLVANLLPISGSREGSEANLGLTLPTRDLGNKDLILEARLSKVKDLQDLEDHGLLLVLQEIKDSEGNGRNLEIKVQDLREIIEDKMTGFVQNAMQIILLIGQAASNVDPLSQLIKAKVKVLLEFLGMEMRTWRKLLMIGIAAVVDLATLPEERAALNAKLPKEIKLVKHLPRSFLTKLLGLAMIVAPTTLIP